MESSDELNDDEKLVKPRPAPYISFLTEVQASDTAKLKTLPPLEHVVMLQASRYGCCDAYAAGEQCECLLNAERKACENS